MPPTVIQLNGGVGDPDGPPIGYNVVFYCADADHSPVWLATPDDVRGSGPHEGSFIFGTDDASGFFFPPNALGYSLITVTSANSDVIPFVLHSPDISNPNKGLLIIDGFGYPPDDNRLLPGFAISFSGALGSPWVYMGVLSATLGVSEVILDWTAGTLAAALGTINYRVSRSTSPTGPFSTIASVGEDLTYNDTSVASGTTYYYRITSGVNLGLGEFLHGSGAAGTFSTDFLSNIVSVTTPGSSPSAVGISFDAIEHE